MIKVCVTDLDGTLWKENSEVCIVEKYYNNKKYSGIRGKIWGKINLNSLVESLNKDFDRIPEEYVRSFSLNTNPSVLDILDKYKKKGFEILILSNAPSLIVDYGMKILKARGYHCEIGKKAKVLRNIYPSIDYLVTISDNKSDEDLFEISDEGIVIINRGRRINIKCKGNIQYVAV